MSALGESVVAWVRSDADARGLTVRQLAVMLACHGDLGTRAGLVARRLALQAPVVTRAADKLEHRGLLVREMNPDDRRSVLMSLTPKGRQLITKLTS